jgi:hypothetical protein
MNKGKGLIAINQKRKLWKEIEIFMKIKGIISEGRIRTIIKREFIRMLRRNFRKGYRKTIDINKRTLIMTPKVIF